MTTFSLHGARAGTMPLLPSKGSLNPIDRANEDPKFPNLPRGFWLQWWARLHVVALRKAASFTTERAPEPSVR